MTDFTFGKGKRKTYKEPVQTEKEIVEHRKRFLLKCASGGFARGGPNKSKISLAPVSFLKDK